ncbi:MAG TPA: hypothetical protein VF211_05030 [Burkholderiales bacterium]
MSRYVKPRAEEPLVLAAVERGVAEALDRHRARGEPVVVWRDGKVVWLRPGEY